MAINLLVTSVRVRSSSLVTGEIGVAADIVASGMGRRCMDV